MTPPKTKSGWPAHHRATGRATMHQLRFLNELACTTTQHPLEAYHSICRAWCAATNASWSWLWMADQMPCPTELQLVGGFAKGILPQPPNLSVQNTNTVAAYCLSTRKPSFVSDLTRWQAGTKNEFRVGLADFLLDHQCRSFLCVPILSHEPLATRGTDWRQPAHGAICLHFPTAEGGVMHTEEAIMLMAAMTVQFLERIHLAHQHRINVALAQLANSHVGASGQPAFVRRSNYAKSVLELLCQELHVDGASIFYHNRLRNCLECVETTGMINNRHSNVASITYLPGQGMTGQCYQTGLPFFSQSHVSTGGGEPRYLERTKDGGLLPAAAIYPIPRNSSQNQKAQGPKAHGVLRLVRHFNPHIGADRVKFDSLSISTIDLVAREIGVVLGGMAHAIRREGEASFANHAFMHALVLLDALRNQIKVQRKKEAPTSIQPKKLDKLFITSDDADDIDLIYTLLRNSNIAGQTVDAAVHEFDVSVAVSNLSRLLSRHPCLNEREHSKPIVVKAPIPLPLLRCEKSKFETAMMNLLINALLHGGKDTFVSVTIGCRQDCLHIDIANGGLGIAEHEVENIFLPGFRGSLGDKGGQGNGLAAALSAVRAIGGQLVLTSERDPTVFRVILPLVPIVDRA